MDLELYKLRSRVKASVDTSWLKKQAIHWLDLWTGKTGSVWTPACYEIQERTGDGGNGGDRTWVTVGTSSKDYAIGFCDGRNGDGGDGSYRVVVDGDIVVYPPGDAYD